MVDFAADFADVVNGLETVTLAYRNGSSVTINHAHRRAVTWKEIEASGGDVRAGDTVWQWPQSESAAQPPLGSTLTDSAGDVWTILGINPSHQITAKWTAVCRQLAVEERLDTLVTIQVATYTKDDWGVAVPTWADAYTDVRARVQPVTQTPDVAHDADEVEQLVRIMLESDLVIVPGADYRVIDSDLEIYQVVRYEQAERIDALPVLVCERTGTSSSSGS